jgi:uncharacterized OsmC-like protein
MSDPDILPPDMDPTIKKIGIRKLSAHNEASARTVTTVRSHEVVTDEANEGDTGPSPLENTLASLTGCEGVIINRCAKAMGFSYSSVDMEAEGDVDPRGSRGVAGVRPYFLAVRLKVRIHTSEPEEQLLKLRKNVENRCPVMNLFRDAGVDVTAEWEAITE